ncbi:MAG: sugar ABC transporter permease YjfF [Verrucomicrobia bacterium]|nr:sugar ABC transporter permease YjfF [Verrucomicrobiota bacterium]
MNLRVLKRNIPFAATAVVCVLLYVFGAVQFYDENFFSLRVFINFFYDNAFLGIAAIGMTFVILSGGIDLSVGGVVGLVSVLLAILMENHGAPPVIAIPLVLLLGAGLGTVMGVFVHYFALPAFLVTLAGMFFARGMALVLQYESVPITKHVDSINSTLSLPLGSGLQLPSSALIYLGAFVLALWLAHFTRFGRNVYAVGGNEQSATLMGLPVARTRVGVYTLSGFCAALAGVTYSLYTSSGNPNAGMGLELDAIAAAVIGGTLLSGGVGYLAGTFVGVLIFGIIQTTIIFQGTLSSWWTKIVVGGLLLLFILLQKGIQAKKLRPKN